MSSNTTIATEQSSHADDTHQQHVNNADTSLDHHHHHQGHHGGVEPSSSSAASSSQDHADSGAAPQHEQQHNQFQSDAAAQSSASASTGKQEAGAHHQSQQQGDHSQQHAQSQQHHHQQAARALLAQWDPEQLAKIVEAARATETGSQSTDASGNYAASAAIYEQARQALAAMPGNLGQAASALSEFAAGFKRSDGVTDQGSDHQDNESPGSGQDSAGQQQEQPSSADQGGETRHQETSHEESSERQGQRQGEGRNASEQQQQHVEGTAHDNAATAAAIAAMGTLAGHHLDNPNEPASAEELSQNLPSNSNARKAKSGKAPESERQRKDNHKEVERRRRAGINSAISELQTIVPGCDEKNVNKGDVIYRAAQYIRDLKTNEASNIEKWTLEKLLMDQAMNDFSAQLDASRREVERLRERFGKEADDVPRAEEISWGQHHEDEQPHHHQAQQGQQQHHNHHHHAQGAHQDHAMDEGHDQQGEQEGQSAQIDSVLESTENVHHENDGRVKGDAQQQAAESHGHATGALNDVAAAAAAAARAVAAQTPAEDSQASSEVTRFSENVEAVRAAAAAAAAGVGAGPSSTHASSKEDAVIDALTNEGTHPDEVTAADATAGLQRSKRASQQPPTPGKSAKRQKA